MSSAKKRIALLSAGSITGAVWLRYGRNGRVYTVEFRKELAGDDGVTFSTSDFGPSDLSALVIVIQQVQERLLEIERQDAEPDCCDEYAV